MLEIDPKNKNFNLVIGGAKKVTPSTFADNEPVANIVLLKVSSKTLPFERLSQMAEEMEYTFLTIENVKENYTIIGVPITWDEKKVLSEDANTIDIIFRYGAQSAYYEYKKNVFDEADVDMETITEYSLNEDTRVSCVNLDAEKLVLDDVEIAYAKKAYYEKYY